MARSTTECMELRLRHGSKALSQIKKSSKVDASSSGNLITRSVDSLNGGRHIFSKTDDCLGIGVGAHSGRELTLVLIWVTISHMSSPVIFPRK
jgi:hypothetical protein